MNTTNKEQSVGELSPLLVFADDWGRHPSSAQHLIRQLLPTRTVLWVNTIGTRAPQLDWLTIQRAWGKLRQWLVPKPQKLENNESQAIPANLNVLNPRMWPWFTKKFDRRLNVRLLVPPLQRAIQELPSPPIAITTLPIVADLIPHLNVRHWVYYCVDDFGLWPGLDRTTMTRMERDLLSQVSTAVAVSENLQARLRGLGTNATLLSHGVDLDFWQHPRGEWTQWDHLPKPWIVFWGVVDPRLHTGMVAALAQRLGQGSILLIGPHQHPDPQLARLPHTHLLPAQPFASLPSLAKRADVLVMPYADLPVTRAMQPLKLKEYLATGRPVVVSDLPANQTWSEGADLVRTPEEFAARVLERLQTGTPPSQLIAREVLMAESWQAKATHFAELIEG
ncbi:MAG: glycosyltransferase [Zavarzinella sp.]